MGTNEKTPVDREKTAPKIQGEGDYESARKYDKDTQHFAETADVSDLAHRAAPHSQQEAAELERAEEVGKSHAKGGQSAESWPKDSASGKPKTDH